MTAGAFLRANWRTASAALMILLLFAAAGAQAILFLVPVAGFLIMRSRTRESSVLLLVTSGAVLGTGLFWLVEWALLGAVHGPWAAFIATFVVFGLAARASEKPYGKEPLPPLEWPSRLEALGVALMMISVGASIYLSATPLLEFSETMIFHVPLVASMQRGNVPPINMSEPPHALYYHYGQHVLAAALGSFGRWPSHIALFASNAWFGALAAGYAYSLVKKAHGTAGGFAAAILFVGAGTLNWLTAWKGRASFDAFARLMTPLGQPFTAGNISLGSFAWRVHGNSMAWAMCCALLTVDLLDRAMRTKRVELAVRAGVALALLAPANETLFAVIASGVGVAPLTRWLIERKLTLRPVVLAAVTGVLGVGLVFFTGGVMKTFLLERSATHGAQVVWEWSQLGSVASWNFGRVFPPPEAGRVPIFSMRFLEDVGPVPFLVLPALVWAAVRRDGALLHLSFASLVALFLGSAMTLTKYPANTFRLVNLSVVVGAIPAGAALASIASRPRLVPVRVASLVVVFASIALLVSSWPLLHLGIVVNATHGWYPARDGGPKYDRFAIEYLMKKTRYRDGVLSIPHDSWAVLGSGQFSPFGSFVGDRPEYRSKSVFAVGDLDRHLLRELGVRYLYVERWRAFSTQKRKLDEGLASGTMAIVWRSSDGKNELYELR